LPPTVLLIIDGDQVPTMPLGEVVFKMGATFPAHKVNVGTKSGVVEEFMVTVVTKLVAHCPEFGVNV
jgi:hypothetical protein